MLVCFSDSETYPAGRYDGRTNPTSHLLECQALWASRPKDEWVHAFLHTLDGMPRSWYVVAELCRTITTWEEFSILFAQTLSFQDANPEVHNALQIIYNVVLKFVLVAYRVDPHAHCSMQSMMTCYNLSRNLKMMMSCKMLIFRSQKEVTMLQH